MKFNNFSSYFLVSGIPAVIKISSESPAIDCFSVQGRNGDKEMPSPGSFPLLSTLVYRFACLFKVLPSHFSYAGVALDFIAHLRSTIFSFTK